MKFITKLYKLCALILGNLKALLFGIILIPAGLFILYPIFDRNVIFETKIICSHRDQLCKEYAITFWGNEKRTDSFKISDIEAIRVKTESRRSRRRTYLTYILLAKVNEKERKIDSVSNTEEIKFEQLKTFLENEKNADFFTKKKNAENNWQAALLGIGLEIIGLFFLYWFFSNVIGIIP